VEDSERPKTPLLGRKPKWLLRWEKWSQGKFEQQSVDAKVVEARNAQVHAPDGRQYLVRTVVNGEMLRSVDSGSLLDLPIALVLALFEMWRKRRRSGWTIAVVRGETLMGKEKVVHRETVYDEAEIAWRVHELAEDVKHGTMPAKS
jgi:hypothetical protein